MARRITAVAFATAVLITSACGAIPTEDATVPAAAVDEHLPIAAEPESPTATDAPATTAAAPTTVAPTTTTAPTTTAAPATTVPPTTAPPTTAPPVATTAPSAPSGVYYKNCTAARDAGAAPVHRGDPGYGSHLDRDGDGVGCEN
jgi:hypothetical protein